MKAFYVAAGAVLVITFGAAALVVAIARAIDDDDGTCHAPFETARRNGLTQ